MKVGAILIPPVFRYMKKQVNVRPAVFEDRTVLSVWQLDKVFFFPLLCGMVLFHLIFWGRRCTVNPYIGCLFIPLVYLFSTLIKPCSISCHYNKLSLAA